MEDDCPQSRLPLWAVIPSGNRLEQLTALVEQLRKDDVKVVIINTGYQELSFSDLDVTVLEDFASPKNISRWWNLGLRYVAEQEKQALDYVVAVLNDDLIVPRRFVARLATAIEMTGAAAAYPDQHRYLLNAPRYHTYSYVGPISLFERMPGYAFALRGSAGIFADETLVWWYGDDDIDWRARQIAGTAMVGDLRVEHLFPSQSTIGELAEQAGKDRQTFFDKWGKTPW